MTDKPNELTFFGAFWGGLALGVTMAAKRQERYWALTAELWRINAELAAPSLVQATAPVLEAADAHKETSVRLVRETVRRVFETLDELAERHAAAELRDLYARINVQQLVNHAAARAASSQTTPPEVN